MNKLGVLEGILFVVGEEGITLDRICNIMEIETDEAKTLLKELQKSYESDARGIRVSFLGNSFKLTTKKEHIDYYQKLVNMESNDKLTTAALEILAIIAYNQPITRVEIDEIRGLSSVSVMRKLLAKDLIKIVGKSDLPGRPNLYKTTSDFLDYFGLSSLDDLPKIENNESPEETKELFTSIYKERDMENS